jgi:hypothetical protein
MRCLACNKTLKEYEAVRKDEEGNYIDLCGGCYRHSRVEDIYKRTDKTEIEQDLTSILTDEGDNEAY